MTIALALFAAYIWAYLVLGGPRAYLRRFVFGWPAFALLLTAEACVRLSNLLLDRDSKVVL